MIVAAPLAVLAVVLLATGARLRVPWLAGAGLVMVALAELTVVVAVHGTARALVAVPAAAVLLGAGELGFGLADGVGAETLGERRAQLGWVLACAAGAAATAFVVLGVDSIGLRRSAVAEIAGAAFAALVVWLLVTAVRGLVGED